MNQLGTWRHLGRRFIDVAVSRPLDGTEHARVDGWLRSDEERSLFWSQSVADQRHGLETAARVASAGSARAELVRAALLHDIGKRHAGLGIVGRSVASLLAKVGIRVGGRLALYLDHGRLGAADLAEAGVESFVREFTLHHHGPRPATIAVDDWVVLQHADR